jgi:hypothetical protein
MRIENK